jgi:signal transduction histidine kinase
VLSIDAVCKAHRIVLEIADQGIGISADEMRHVTTKFFRGRRDDLAGSGLGLAIVDRIVKDHHGLLNFRSAVGSGTTVVITLPIVDA